MTYTIKFNLEIDEDSHLEPLKTVDISQYLKQNLENVCIDVSEVEILEINV